MSKDKDKRLEEKEKLEAEIERSLSVVNMKKAHMKIEKIEKTRKKSSILSIIERIDNNINDSETWIEATAKLISSKTYNLGSLKLGDSPSMVANNIMKTYESIREDLQRNINCKSEDFDKLFPKPIINFEIYTSASTSLSCLSSLMHDMKIYCKRLL
jgi:hypothetical protein